MKSRPKIVVTNCWSYYNKGDAAIAIATVRLINRVVQNAEITLLAHDYTSFSEHRMDLGNVARILPMPCIVDSLRQVRTLFGLASHVCLRSIFGSLFLMLSLVSIRFLRRIDRILDRTLRSIDDSDLVIAVGGNYVHSDFGFYEHAIPIVYAKFIAKKKTIMLGHSVGPFAERISRIIPRLILSHIDLIVFREVLSSLYVGKELRANLSNALVSVDMAFLLQSSDATFKALRHVGTRPLRVGINARKWFYHHSNLYVTYLRSMVRVAFNLAKSGYEVYLIPFSYVGKGGDDLQPCRIIHNIVGQYSKRVHLLDMKEQSPTSFIKIIRKLGLRFFIGTRMHSVILASLASVPSVTISYQHFKGHGISKQLGTSKYVIKIEDVKPHILMRYVKKLMKNQEIERKNLVERVRRLRKINEQRMSSMLAQLINRSNAK